VKVRMIVEVSGTRGDGRDWPAVGGVVDVDSGEGADLVAAGLAVRVADVGSATKQENGPETGASDLGVAAVAGKPGRGRKG